MSQPVKNALLSVYNKTGIVPFAQALVDMGVTVWASGGTAKKLQEHNVPVRDVADIVGGKAILGHRVVTLARELYAALLATDSPEDQAELDALGVPRIDLVCVDMYPLEAEIAAPDARLESVIEKTDIGGPTMLRAAAKGGRIVLCDFSDWDKTIKWLSEGQPDGVAFRRALAAKAEATVANYVLTSARYLGEGQYDGFVGSKKFDLCYGENRHQKKAAFLIPLSHQRGLLGLDHLDRIEGTDPSFINMTDVHRTIETATRICVGFADNFGSTPYMVIGVKHGNACGVGTSSHNPHDAVRRMVAGAHQDLSGGSVFCNFNVGEETAQLLRSHLVPEGEDRRVLDNVVAPSFSPQAVEELARKKTQKCRLFTNPSLINLVGTPNDSHFKPLDLNRRFRPVRGGFLVQDADMFVFKIPNAWKTTLGVQDQEDMVLAWAIGCTSNSNSIILVKNGMLIGAGRGLTSRAMACRVAVMYAQHYGHETKDAIGYSDSFFPFPDGPLVLAQAGIRIVFATSGSIRDKEVNEICAEADLKLYQLPDTEARGFYGH